jgi:hypothetical protein
MSQNLSANPFPQSTATFPESPSWDHRRPAWHPSNPFPRSAATFPTSPAWDHRRPACYPSNPFPEPVDSHQPATTDTPNLPEHLTSGPKTEQREETTHA